MKKKLLSLCLVAVLALTAVVGTTLAYFTDNDQETNTFTIGDVRIDLLEEFDEENARLVPGKIIDKQVTVKNIGTNDAYVRVHMAIPSDLVDQNINAYNDMVHVNFPADGAIDGLWSWHPTNVTGNGWTANGRANNNTYNTTIDGEEYTVWIITYRTALKYNEETPMAISQVYMDQFVDTEIDAENNVTSYTKPFYTDKQNGTVDVSQSFTWPANKNIDIKIFAEAVQSEGFEDAYTAFATAYEAPTAKKNPWNSYTE